MSADDGAKGAEAAGTREGGAPILPSRYNEVLSQRVAEQAERLLAAAQAARPPLELPKWGMPALLLGLGLVVVLVLMGQSDAAPAKSRVAFDQSAVISTGSVGTHASAEDLLPPRAASPSPQAASVSPADLHVHNADGHAGSDEEAMKLVRERERGDRPIPRRAPSTPRTPKAGAACSTCGVKTPPASPDPESVLAAMAVPSPSPSPTPKPVINVGTRLSAALTFPVTTAFAGGPVSAVLQADAASASGDVLFPAGTTLVGQAFSTITDDRAQIVFTALVRDGKTIPFRGVVVGIDNVLGVPGKVIRKASAKKKGIGRVLGAIGSAATFGLVGRGADGMVGDTAEILASQAAGDLTNLERNWEIQRSDKVVQVKAGTAVTVYVQGDVSLP